MTTRKGFHSTYDSIARPSFAEDKVSEPGLYFTHLNGFSYQFSSHFHPYVTELIRNLNEGGIDGLQDTDTQYQPEKSPLLNVIPNSTRAVLSSVTKAIRPDGTINKLAVGTHMTILDGINVNGEKGTQVVQNGPTIPLPNPISVTLPGCLPMLSSGGIQFTGPGGSTFILPDDCEVTLQDNAPAVLANDGLQVTLPKDAKVRLWRGQPEPVLFDDFFCLAYGPTTLSS